MQPVGVGEWKEEGRQEGQGTEHKLTAMPRADLSTEVWARGGAGLEKRASAVTSAVTSAFPWFPQINYSYLL